ncbi:MAG: glycosyltransferase family 4 protein [Gallionella sp.]|nr:glycosyltransferase family 4 protein [Gallionella sp.]MDD4946746.1 glycosyltransferase family 4 protein [Gallionella sp.]
MLKKKKIVIALNTAWNLFNFRAGLIRALVAAGYEVVAVAPNDSYAPRLAELGCRYIALPMDNKGTNPLMDTILFFRFLRLFWQERPEVFLGYTIKPNIYGSLAAHLTGVAVINNIAGLGTAFIRDGWLTRLVRLLYKVALSGSRHVFFQNNDDLALFVGRGLVAPDKVSRIPGSGIDLAAFRNQVSKQAQSQSFSFLLVARLLRDKGVGEYVEAARIVRRDNPAVKFQILGFLDAQNPTAVTKAEMSAWVEEGVVEYLGVSDDVRPFLAAADCVVLPSYREGVPRSLLEAAAMAKPIVATDVVGCRDVVTDRVNGLLCKVADAKDLAGKMLEMLHLPYCERNQMGLAGRAKMEEEFDEAVVINQYITRINGLSFVN